MMRNFLEIFVIRLYDCENKFMIFGGSINSKWRKLTMFLLSLFVINRAKQTENQPGIRSEPLHSNNVI